MRSWWKIAGLVVSMVCVACTPSSDKPSNNPLLHMPTMVHFLTDLHLREAMVSENFAVRTEAAWLYQELFNSYHITASQFNEAILLYRNDNKLYQELYKLVTEELHSIERKANKGTLRYYYPPVPSIWTYYGKFPENDSTLVRYSDFAYYLQLPATELRTHHRSSYPYVQGFGSNTPFWKIRD